MVYLIAPPWARSLSSEPWSFSPPVSRCLHRSDVTGAKFSARGKLCLRQPSPRPHQKRLERPFAKAIEYDREGRGQRDHCAKHRESERQRRILPKNFSGN